MKPIRLNQLFEDVLPNFAHIIKEDKQTKFEFMDYFKQCYDVSELKNRLVYISITKSRFDTIRKSESKILFNC